LANPFDKSYTNAFLADEEQAKEIDALIIVFDVPLETQVYYENPKLISRAQFTQGQILKAYMDADGAREDVYAVLEHRYLVDCVAVKSLQFYYLFFTFLYLVGGGLWIHLVWYKYEHEALHIQKMLIAPIFLKVFQVFIFAIYVG